MIGDHSASALYVKNKEMTCREVGIVTTRVNLPASTSTREVIALLARLNADQAIDGILLQVCVCVYDCPGAGLVALAGFAAICGHPLP